MKRMIRLESAGITMGHAYVGWKANGLVGAYFNDLKDCKRFELKYVRDEYTKKIFRVRGNRLQNLIAPERIEWCLYIGNGQLRKIKHTGRENG